MNLFTTAYWEPDENRREELSECLERNIESNLFDNIYVLVEGDLPEFAIQPVIARHQEGRQTFGQLFDWVSEVSQEDSINVVANSDIYFDDSLLMVNAIDMIGTCLALSPHDVQSDGRSIPRNLIDTQDCWIFKGRIPPMSADFGPGKAGCDNRIAWEIQNAGYEVLNPSLTIKAHHLHLTGVRHYDPKDIVLGPYKLIPPTILDI